MKRGTFMTNTKEITKEKIMEAFHFRD
ncbi:NAD(P)H-dependent oxidoreductase, partial [Bacillus thuringiensis]|nr:NAD(P)H-dependent oxidoreductase [Bacillus thuringiensis]